MKERRSNRIRCPQGEALLAGGGCPGKPRKTIERLTLLIGIVLLALAGCGPPPDSVAEQLVEAVNTQDLDGALRLFAPYAVVDAGNDAPFVGKGEIQRWLERLYADNVSFDEVKPDESESPAKSEDRFSAHYRVKTDSARELGVAYLEGVGEMTVQEGRIMALSFDLSEGTRADLLRAGAPVLSYAVLPDPDPLRASPGAPYTPNRASLTVVVTNDAEGPVQVRSIIFRLPEGSGAGDLTPNISGVKSDAPIHWHLTPPEMPVHWNLTSAEGRFTLAPELPQDGKLEAGEGLSFRLSKIEISDKPGVWDLEIVEETGDDTWGSTTIQLAKFPFELYVSDLGAQPLVVEQGGHTWLSWKGSDGATYDLLYGEVITDVTGKRSIRVDGLTQTTTFYLTATLVGGEDPPPVIRERTVTVMP